MNANPVKPQQPVIRALAGFTSDAVHFARQFSSLPWRRSAQLILIVNLNIGVIVD